MASIKLNNKQNLQTTFREEPTSQVELQSLVATKKHPFPKEQIQSSSTLHKNNPAASSKRLKRLGFLSLTVMVLLFLAVKGYIQIDEFEEQQIDIAEDIVSSRIYLNPPIHKQIQPFSLPVYCRASSFNQENSLRLPFLKTNFYRFDKLPYSKLTLVQELYATFPAQHYPEMAMYLKENPINNSIYIHSAPLYLTLLLGAFTPNSVNIVIPETNPLRKLITTNYVLNNLQHRLIFQASESSQGLKQAELVVTSASDWALEHLGRSFIYVVEREAYKLDGMKVLKLESIPSCSPLQSKISPQKQLRSGLYLVQPIT